MDNKLTLTIAETAHELSISRSQCYELARQGVIPGVVRLGAKRIVVSRAVLVKWLEQAGGEAK